MKKILIVDDELDILKVVVFRLKRAGYDILTAADGAAALKLIESEKPDLVLLDLRLPVMDGHTVCRKLKNDERTKHIPVIIFTASSNIHTDDRCKDLKADDFLVKPFDMDVLLDKVRKFVG